MNSVLIFNDYGFNRIALFKKKVESRFMDSIVSELTINIIIMNNDFKYLLSVNNKYHHND